MRSLTKAIGYALGAGLAVAVPATVIDWRRNPASLFRDDTGTNWSIVAETAFSWFWPVAVPVFILTLAASLFLARKRATRS